MHLSKLSVVLCCGAGDLPTGMAGGPVVGGKGLDLNESGIGGNGGGGGGGKGG